MTESTDERCPKSPGQIHCVHWWDGDRPCCACGVWPPPDCLPEGSEDLGVWARARFLGVFPLVWMERFRSRAEARKHLRLWCRYLCTIETMPVRVVGELPPFAFGLRLVSLHRTRNRNGSWTTIQVEQVRDWLPGRRLRTFWRLHGNWQDPYGYSVSEDLAARLDAYRRWAVRNEHYAWRWSP